MANAMSRTRDAAPLLRGRVDDLFRKAEQAVKAKEPAQDRGQKQQEQRREPPAARPRSAFERQIEQGFKDKDRIEKRESGRAMHTEARKATAKSGFEAAVGEAFTDLQRMNGSKPAASTRQEQKKPEPKREAPARRSLDDAVKEAMATLNQLDERQRPERRFQAAERITTQREVADRLGSDKAGTASAGDRIRAAQERTKAPPSPSLPSAYSHIAGEHAVRGLGRDSRAEYERNAARDPYTLTRPEAIRTAYQNIRQEHYAQEQRKADAAIGQQLGDRIPDRFRDKRTDAEIIADHKDKQHAFAERQADLRMVAHGKDRGDDYARAALARQFSWEKQEKKSPLEQHQADKALASQIRQSNAVAAWRAAEPEAFRTAVQESQQQRVSDLGRKAGLGQQQEQSRAPAQRQPEQDRRQEPDRFQRATGRAAGIQERLVPRQDQQAIQQRREPERKGLVEQARERAAALVAAGQRHYEAAKVTISTKVTAWQQDRQAARDQQIERDRDRDMLRTRIAVNSEIAQARDQGRQSRPQQVQVRAQDALGTAPRPQPVQQQTQQAKPDMEARFQRAAGRAATIQQRVETHEQQRGQEKTQDRNQDRDRTQDRGM